MHVLYKVWLASRLVLGHAVHRFFFKKKKQKTKKNPLKTLQYIYIHVLSYQTFKT